MADENASIYGQYTEQIEKLKEVMEIAKANTKQNKTFRQTLTQKIQEITNLIQTLESLIYNFINSRNANVRKIQDNNVEMNELQTKLNFCKKKLAEVTAEKETLSNKAPEEVKNTSELDGKIAGLENDVKTYLEQIDKCNEALNDRSKELLQLKEILKEQDNTIKEVTNYLSGFSSDEQNNLDIDKLTEIITRLNEMITKVQSPPVVDAVQEAQQSVSAISAITNTKNPQTGETKTTTQLQDEDDIELTEIKPKEIYVDGMSYNDIINGLQNKAKQLQNNKDNKYNKAYNLIYKKNLDEDKIRQILKQNSITIKNKQIMGGRKTRKKSRITKKRHKTQKGGYFYNKHRTSKRRKISSNLYKSSRRRNSKSKSNNSS